MTTETSKKLVIHPKAPRPPQLSEIYGYPLLFGYGFILLFFGLIFSQPSQIISDLTKIMLSSSQLLTGYIALSSLGTSNRVHCFKFFRRGIFKCCLTNIRLNCLSLLAKNAGDRAFSSVITNGFRLCFFWQKSSEFLTDAFRDFFICEKTRGAFS